MRHPALHNRRRTSRATRIVSSAIFITRASGLVVLARAFSLDFFFASTSSSCSSPLICSSAWARCSLSVVRRRNEAAPLWCAPSCRLGPLGRMKQVLRLVHNVAQRSAKRRVFGTDRFSAAVQTRLNSQRVFKVPEGFLHGEVHGQIVAKLAEQFHQVQLWQIL